MAVHCVAPRWHGGCYWHGPDGVRSADRHVRVGWFSRIGSARNRKGEQMDLLYIGLAVAFFGLSWGLIEACERLG